MSSSEELSQFFPNHSGVLTSPRKKDLENIVGGEKDGKQHFLLFPQCSLPCQRTYITFFTFKFVLRCIERVVLYRKEGHLHWLKNLESPIITSIPSAYKFLSLMLHEFGTIEKEQLVLEEEVLLFIMNISKCI